MVAVTDMTGRPLSPIIDPCPWFAERAGDPDLPGACSIEWQPFADTPDLAPRFSLGGHGCECARALIRSGTVAGMSVAVAEIRRVLRPGGRFWSCSTSVPWTSGRAARGPWGWFGAGWRCWASRTAGGSYALNLWWLTLA
jgi:hypothetical protein